jgi:hypothetical protein
MKISRTHKEFAKRLNKQDVLNHPEIYLGPNWAAVIDFWLYLDTLTIEQLMVVYERYYALSIEELNIAYNKACRAARVTTKYCGLAGPSSYCIVVHRARSAACRATEELIGLDKLLEQDHQLVFFPLFLNP